MSCAQNLDREQREFLRYNNKLKTEVRNDENQETIYKRSEIKGSDRDAKLFSGNKMGAQLRLCLSQINP